MKRSHIIIFIVVGLVAIGASYLWNRWLEHDIAHDIPQPQADSTTTSDSKAR